MVDILGFISYLEKNIQFAFFEEKKICFRSDNKFSWSGPPTNRRFFLPEIQFLNDENKLDSTRFYIKFLNNKKIFIESRYQIIRSIGIQKEDPRKVHSLRGFIQHVKHVTVNYKEIRLLLITGEIQLFY